MAAENGRLRASDAERERIIEALRRHTADGRLTLEEFEERVGEALAATTRDDLGPVLRDLPALPPDRADRPRVTASRSGWPTAGAARAVLGAVAVVAVVTLLVTSGWGMWWIVFPLMGVFGGCGRPTRSCGSGRALQTDGRHRHGDRQHDVGGETIRV